MYHPSSYGSSSYKLQQRGAMVSPLQARCMENAGSYNKNILLEKHFASMGLTPQQFSAVGQHVDGTVPSEIWKDFPSFPIMLAGTNQSKGSSCNSLGESPARSDSSEVSSCPVTPEKKYNGNWINNDVALRSPGVPDANRVLQVKSDEEMFARKVFVGGLPIDVSEQEVWQTFKSFGNVLVDWPRRPDIMAGRSVAGYVFLVFEEERAVRKLVSECHREGDRYYLFISSPTMRDKPVQVRPWKLSDMEYMPDPMMPLDTRRTVFIGGVPRPTKAKELAECLNYMYGSVCYVGIDIDPELKYPKGAARVTFTTTQAYIAAISGRFVHVNHAESQKRVEIKPYVMDEQMCDECYGKRCLARYAPYFCGDVGCLQYYCEDCWDNIHLCHPKRAEHRPLVRMGDQTRVLASPPHHSSQNHLRSSRHLPFPRQTSYSSMI